MPEGIQSTPAMNAASTTLKVSAVLSNQIMAVKAQLRAEIQASVMIHHRNNLRQILLTS